MHPIFFIWDSADHEAVRPTGIGACGSWWHCAPLDNVSIGVVFSDHPNARSIVDQKHPQLMTLPGLNGKLQDKHISRLKKQFPNVKAGDSIAAIINEVHARHGHACYNPDAY